jgi:GNAT superfamily N-acetyltransferase
MPVIDLLLRAARGRPGVRMETLWRQDFTDERIAELHAMACRLMAEDLAHFRVHAETTEVVHIFRRVDTGELVGFQFWRTAPMNLPGCRAILGGKLRVLPEFRGRGLHLLSGLLFFLQNKARHPLTRYYRLSIAGLLGFVSITEALRNYQVLDPHDRSPEGRAVMAAFTEMAAQNHFRVDPETGLIFVNILMTPETLARFGPSYFARPAALRYAELNPDYRSNGLNVGFWFRFTPANLLSLTRVIGRKLRRDG